MGGRHRAIHLVVIDEAGMADTVSLDAAVSYIVEQGGSIRLIGDDQQLAAIGACGVLRDIQATHGAVRLTEPLRFSDPAEAAPTLALRDGKPEAIGFYLDNQRIANDRQLRLTATDWVKNGDRWIVQAISAGGDLDVQHLRNRHRVRLPAAYCCARQPTASRCPMITPQRHCGGGSADTSPPPS
jgi:AAA domain